MKIDSGSLAWTLLLTVVTTLLFGCVPGLKLSVDNVQESLKDSGQGMSAGRRHETLRATMVISEVALACVLLIGAGLLFRSLLAVLDVDLGFQPSRAAVMKIDYDDGNNHDRREAVLQEILRSVAAIPGVNVEGAGITDMLPLGRNRTWSFEPKGKTYLPGIPGDLAYVRIVTPGYLSAMGMHLGAGRDFSWRDTSSAPPVMIVNQAAARRFWPGINPLGQIAFKEDGEKAPTRVVGVLANVRENSLETLPGPGGVFAGDAIRSGGKAELVVRTSLPPDSLASSVMKTLRSLNPAQPASELLPLQQIVDRSVSPRRFFAVLVASFALLGLVLAALV